MFIDGIATPVCHRNLFTHALGLVKHMWPIFTAVADELPGYKMIERHVLRLVLVTDGPAARTATRYGCFRAGLCGCRKLRFFAPPPYFFWVLKARGRHYVSEAS